MEKNKFSIGEFSEMTGLSIRTLHYYDEIGLLQPEKHPTSGHRIYDQQNLLTLQQILSLKFLGYRLEEIAKLLNETTFTMDLNQTLSLHLQALEAEKERIEQSITAIRRVIKVLEEEGEVERTVLLSLIHFMQAEPIQKEWMKKHSLTEVVDKLSKKSEKEIMALDQNFISLSKQVKQLFGTPVDDPRVQQMVQTYLEASFEFLGEELIQPLAKTNMEELEIQELEKLTFSPYTDAEQTWLTEAMEYYMRKVEGEQ